MSILDNFYYKHSEIELDLEYYMVVLISDLVTARGYQPEPDNA